MFKPFFVILFLSATVLSSCLHPPNHEKESPEQQQFRKLYEDDAMRLAIRETPTDSPFADAVKYRFHLLNLKAIMEFVMKNKTVSLKGIESIHTTNNPETRRLFVFLSNDSLSKNWKNSEDPTGNPAFDFLMKRYKLRLESYSSNPEHKLAILDSDTPLNVTAIVPHFIKLKSLGVDSCFAANSRVNLLHVSTTKQDILYKGKGIYDFMNGEKTYSFEVSSGGKVKILK